MKRKIVLDTETTGLEVENGDRIIEIGAVEIIDNVITGREFHTYINPNRNISEGAFQIHGISNQFLSDKPSFKNIADDFLNFIKGSELVIHNANFDIGFLNKELDMVDKGSLWDYVSNATCTLELSKRFFSSVDPELGLVKVRGHNLDKLCERLSISTEDRSSGHGGLIDSQLLAKCYIRINELYSSEDIEADLEQKNWVRPPIKRFNVDLLPIKLTAKEEVMHQEFISKISDADKVTSLFNKTNSMKP